MTATAQKGLIRGAIVDILGAALLFGMVFIPTPGKSEEHPICYMATGEGCEGVCVSLRAC